MEKNQNCWLSDENYQKCKAVFFDLKVINDLAERGLALRQQSNSCLTRSKEQKQYLSQVVEKHRKKFPSVTKGDITAAYSKI